MGTRWCHSIIYHAVRENETRGIEPDIKSSFSAYRFPSSRRRITDPCWIPRAWISLLSERKCLPDSVHQWNTPYSILGSSRGEGNSRNFIASLTAEGCRRVKMRRLDPRGRLRERTLARRSFSALCLPTLQSRPRNECTPRARNSSRIITHPFLMASCALPLPDIFSRLRVPWH